MNLSHYHLSKDEISILSKGLSFIPNPKTVDTDDIIDGIDKLKTQMVSKTEKRRPTTKSEAYTIIGTRNQGQKATRRHRCYDDNCAWRDKSVTSH